MIDFKPLAAPRPGYVHPTGLRLPSGGGWFNGYVVHKADAEGNLGAAIAVKLAYSGSARHCYETRSIAKMTDQTIFHPRAG
jgi:hypothetical protein